MKFGSRFRNLLGIKHYSYSIRFDIFIAQCLVDLFFTGRSVESHCMFVGQR